MRKLARVDSEEDLQDQVLRYLNLVPWCLAFEFYNSAVYSRRKRNFLKKDQLWRPNGIPDIVMIYRGRTHWIELKRPKYRTTKNGGLSPAQVETQAKMMTCGWKVSTCYSVLDVRKLLDRLDGEAHGND